MAPALPQSADARRALAALLARSLVLVTRRPGLRASCACRRPWKYTERADHRQRPPGRARRGRSPGVTACPSHCESTYTIARNTTARQQPRMKISASTRFSRSASAKSPATPEPEGHEAGQVQRGIADHQTRGRRHRVRVARAVEERGAQQRGSSQRHARGQIHDEEPQHHDRGPDEPHRDALAQRVSDPPRHARPRPDTASSPHSLSCPPGPSGLHIRDQNAGLFAGCARRRKKLRGTLYRTAASPLPYRARSACSSWLYASGIPLAPLPRVAATGSDHEAHRRTPWRESRRRPRSRASGGRICRIRIATCAARGRAPWSAKLSAVTGMRARGGPCSWTRKGARGRPTPIPRGRRRSAVPK